VRNAGVGAGAFGAAGVVLVFALFFGLFALAEGLAAAGLYRWLAFLIVTALLLLLVGLFAAFGIRKVKRVRAPQRTITTSRQTVAYLRDHAPRG
jgi:membrane-bound ClpP family serine protease